MKRDKYDSDELADELHTGNDKLVALTNEAIRSVEVDNSNKKWYIFKALLGGVTAGATTAATAVAAGVVVSTTAPVVITAATTVSGGYFVKRKLDTLWNEYFSKKKNE